MQFYFHLDFFTSTKHILFHRQQNFIVICIKIEKIVQYDMPVKFLFAPELYMFPLLITFEAQLSRYE